MRGKWSHRKLLPLILFTQYIRSRGEKKDHEKEGEGSKQVMWKENMISHFPYERLNNHSTQNNILGDTSKIYKHTHTGGRGDMY